MSVFAHHARLILGQLAVDEKSNEIPCVRKLLRLCRKMRLLVTVDAMHTQTATAKPICGTLKSHYLMIVKSNQPELLARINALPWAQAPVTHDHVGCRWQSQSKGASPTPSGAARGEPAARPNLSQVQHGKLVRDRIPARTRAAASSIANGSRVSSGPVIAGGRSSHVGGSQPVSGSIHPPRLSTVSSPPLGSMHPPAENTVSRRV